MKSSVSVELEVSTRLESVDMDAESTSTTTIMAAARATERIMLTSIHFVILTAKVRQGGETIVSQWEKKVPFRENVVFWQSQNVKKCLA